MVLIYEQTDHSRDTKLVVNMALLQLKNTTFEIKTSWDKIYSQIMLIAKGFMWLFFFFSSL